MKDLGVMAAGMLLFGAIVFGVVTAGNEPADGANTKNGVSNPPLPQGISVVVNRLEAPNGR